jgi:hypothetical protein
MATYDSLARRPSLLDEPGNFGGVCGYQGQCLDSRDNSMFNQPINRIFDDGTHAASRVFRSSRLLDRLQAVALAKADA